MIQIEFRINEVSNAFFSQLQTLTESVTHLYHAVQHYSPTEFFPLQTDSFPIGFENKEFQPDAVRNNSLKWLFKKAFEEFIIGLTNSLIEAHKFAKYRELSINTEQNNWVMSKEEIEIAIEKINIKPLSMHFPVLIKEIEDLLGFTFQLRDEIISINQVRNCLIHGNGRVRLKDINNFDTNSLSLRYIDLVFYHEKEGEMVELTWEQKKEGFQTNRLGYKVLQKNIDFKLEQDIIMNQDIFNGVAYTCAAFVQYLQEKLPNPTPINQ